MPFQPEGLDARTLKRLAQRLRKGFQQQFPDVPCTPHQAQAMLATTLGHASWHAALRAAPPAVVRTFDPLPLTNTSSSEDWLNEVARGLRSALFPDYPRYVLSQRHLFDPMADDRLGLDFISGPTGMLPVWLLLDLRNQPELLHDETFTQRDDPSALVNMVLVVRVERLASQRHWSPHRVVQRLVAIVKSAPMNEDGTIRLDPLYDLFYEDYGTVTPIRSHKPDAVPDLA